MKTTKKWNDFLVIICVCLIPVSVTAQSFMMQPPAGEGPGLQLKYMHPNFKHGGDDLSILSGIYQLSGSIPVSPNTEVLLMLPFGTYKVEDYDGESSIGDIFLGGRTMLDPQAYFTFGCYLPTADEDEFAVNYFSIYTDFYEFHQFAPNYITLYGNFSKINQLNETVQVNLEIGPTVMIPTESDDDMETEVYAHYGLSLNVQAHPLMVGCELIGQAIITEDVDEPEDRFVHLLTLGAQMSRGQVRPGIFWMIPLKEEFKDILSSTFGIQVSVVL